MEGAEHLGWELRSRMGGLQGLLGVEVGLLGLDIRRLRLNRLNLAPLQRHIHRLGREELWRRLILLRYVVISWRVGDPSSDKALAAICRG